MGYKLNELSILINPEIFNTSNSRFILQTMLNMIENVPDIKFLWHENLYKVFFDDNYEIAKNLYNNNYAIMGRIFAKNLCIEEGSTEVNVTPEMFFVNNAIKSTFFKIVHTLIAKSINNLPLLDNENNLYQFECECHDIILSAKSIFSIENYMTLEENKLYRLYWPNNKEEFQYKFSLILKFKEIINGYELNDRKYKQIEYSSKFINSVINFEQSYRNKFIESIVKRLHVSQNEAKRTSLKDEPIVNSDNIRRFYITRDNGRIHYSYSGKSGIKFIELSLDHDRGL